ncbi:MAG: Gfo/Idh/MocA family oxidoreductase [Clostridia bacterium]|nr:Gfo/Idh/MocA family oxidoreductase [Clostridia bacterium]
MFRIGMLGSDGGGKGGHAIAFTKLLNSGDYDTKVVGICGDNPEETKELAETAAISLIAEKPEELLDKVDAVCVMPRDGNRHLYYAMPFAKAGIPIFIDKPFTCTVEDAKILADAAKENGALLCGGTSVKYAAVFKELQALVSEKNVTSGYFSFPITLHSQWGGMHFYSHHLIEEMLQVFGLKIQSVTAVQVGDNLVVVAKYPDFPVIMNYASSYGGVHAGAYFNDETSFLQEVNLDGGYRRQCEAFIETLKTGKGDDPDYYVLAVKISNAICKAMDENREVFINEM